MLHRLCLSRRQRSCLTVPVLKPGRPAAHQAAVGEAQEGQVDRVVLVGAAQAADVIDPAQINLNLQQFL